jgi:PAS domain S-box-containing protein
MGTLDVRAEPSSVGTARRFVEHRLYSAGLPREVIETAVLLTSELVTNAVMHSGTEIEVRVGVGQGAMIEVRDRSGQHLLRRQHAVDAVSGRGLELVELLADTFGVVPIPGFGKSVWFVVGDPSQANVTKSWGDDVPETGTVDVTEVVEVSLRHLPVVLYDVMREHSEALLREYTLQLLERPGENEHALRDVTAAEKSRLTVFVAVSKWRATLPGAEVPDHADLTLPVSTDDVSGFQRLPAVVAAAEQDAAEGRLLTRPALPEVASLRQWLMDQIVGQLRGGQPTPWAYADHPMAVLAPPVAVDTSWVNATDEAVIIGDDTNRIMAVSPSAAFILGWNRDALVGQRLMAIIPPRLREAHIAGFTRHLVTGRRQILDQQLELPALHHDGHELTVTLTLTRRAYGDRAVFCAWLNH